MNREKIINILPVVGISLIALALVSLITVLAVSMITEKQFLNARSELAVRTLDFRDFKWMKQYDSYMAELDELANEAEKNVGNYDPKFWDYFNEKEKQLMEVSMDLTIIDLHYGALLKTLFDAKMKNDLKGCEATLIRMKEILKSAETKLAAYKQKYP